MGKTRSSKKMSKLINKRWYGDEIQDLSIDDGSNNAIDIPQNSINNDNTRDFEVDDNNNISFMPKEDYLNYLKDIAEGRIKEVKIKRKILKTMSRLNQLGTVNLIN